MTVMEAVRELKSMVSQESLAPSSATTATPSTSLPPWLFDEDV